MAKQRINIMDLKQLVRLKKEGHSNIKTAELLLVSRNTVNEYVRIFSTHNLSFEELTQFSGKEIDDLFPCAKQEVSDHFADISKMVDLGSGAKPEIDDIMLTR